MELRTPKVIDHRTCKTIYVEDIVDNGPTDATYIGHDESGAAAEIRVNDKNRIFVSVELW